MPFRRGAGDITVHAVQAVTPKHMQQLGVMTVIKQPLDQHKVVAGLIVPVYCGWREGIEGI